jgi:hypothetical protein
MRRLRTPAVLLLALALLVSACSSTDDDDTTEGTEDTAGTGDTTASTSDTASQLDESTVGITDDTITISVLASDNEALVAAGLVPDIGDPLQDFQTFADLANEAGGAAGRRLEVTSHLFPVGSTATDQRPACIQATEDDQAAVVIFIGAQARETVLCVAEDHERIVHAQTGIMLEEDYDRGQRRIFNYGMSADRLMAGFAAALDAHGTLDGATLGLVRPDAAEHEAVAAKLTEALEGLGYEIAEEIALPCAPNECSQYDTAVQRFQSAGVDTVFSLLGAVPYPAMVGAAAAVGYEPQWLSSDFENQVYDVTAQFMESAAASYEGAIGFTYGLEEPAEDPYGEECHARFNEATGVSYEYDTDAWRLVRSACYMIQRIVDAADIAQEEHGAVNQATLIQAFETFDYALGDQRGEWTPTKHDAADTVVLKEFSADCLCWSEIEGTRDTFTG